MTMARSDNQAKSGGAATLEEEPQVQSEPKPPYPKQKLEKPGLEAEMELKPKWRGPEGKGAREAGGEGGGGAGGARGPGPAGGGPRSTRRPASWRARWRW